MAGATATIFSGIRFVLLGFDSVSESQYRAELVRGGGVDVGRYDKSCTHLIVFGRVFDDPVCVAARKDGTTVVTELWIEDSVDFGRLADAGRILYRPVRDLNGIPGSDALYICLTGYQRQERDDIMKMVDLMGAHFSKPLIANKITHLICYKFDGEKYDLAKRVNIKLVNHLWLEDCLKAWELLPTDNYSKSGWELEVLEAEAKDSEEETEDESVRPPIEKNTAGDPILQTNMPKHGSSDLSMQLGEMFKTRKHTEFNKQSTCDAEDNVTSNGSLSTPCRNFAHDNTSHIYGNDKLTGMTNYHDGCGSEEQMQNSYILTKLVEIGDINLKKDNNNLLFDVGNTGGTHPEEAKSPSSSYLRKTTEKISPEQPQNLHASLQGIFLKNGTKAGINISSLASKEKTPDSINLKAAPVDTSLCQEDVSSYLLPQKRKVSLSESASSSPHSYQNSKPHSLSSSAITTSAELKATMLSEANEVVNDSYIASGSINLAGVASGKSMLNHDTNQSRITPLNHSKRLLKPGQISLRGRSSNIVVLPKIANCEVNPSFNEEPRQEMDWTTSSNVNMSVMKPRISCNSVSPARDSVTVSFDNIGSEKADNLKTCMSHAAKHLECLIMDGSDTGGSLANKKQPGSLSFSPQKTKLPVPCDKLDVSMKDLPNLPTEVAKQQQKIDEKTSTLDSLKSDVTKLPIGTSPKDAKGKIAETSKVPYKKAIPKKMMCSRPRVNKSRSCNGEAAAFSDKSLTKNKASSRLEKVECEKVTADKQNHVVNLVSNDVLMEDNTEVTLQCPSKCNSVKVNADMVYASEDSEKENQPVKIEGLVNSVTCSNKKKGKHIGELMHHGETVGESTVNEGILEMHPRTISSEPMWFILSGHRLQRKEFRQVIRRLRGRVCRDSHNWSYQATHFIVPEPVRRTEKLFAAAAAGRWILKTDYLSASNEAGKFVAEEPFEWYKDSLSEDAAVDLEAPRKWRHLKERTGHGAFYGLRIIIYGECFAPSLDTLKRVVKAGDGTILATSPPYARFLESGIDFAIISEGIPLVDLWIQEFLRHEIPCVVADYLVQYVCKPGNPHDKHILFKTNAWAEKTLANHFSRLEEIVSDAARQSEVDEELSCAVCGSRDRGEVMLICGDEEETSGCGIGTHIDCCEPPLAAVPEEDWFCKNCSESKRNGNYCNGKNKGKSSTKGR